MLNQSAYNDTVWILKQSDHNSLVDLVQQFGRIDSRQHEPSSVTTPCVDEQNVVPLPPRVDCAGLIESFKANIRATVLHMVYPKRAQHYYRLRHTILGWTPDLFAAVFDGFKVATSSGPESVSCVVWPKHVAPTVTACVEKPGLVFCDVRHMLCTDPLLHQWCAFENLVKDPTKASGACVQFVSSWKFVYELVVVFTLNMRELPQRRAKICLFVTSARWQPPTNTLNVPRPPKKYVGLHYQPEQEQKTKNVLMSLTS